MFIVDHHKDQIEITSIICKAITLRVYTKNLHFMEQVDHLKGSLSREMQNAYKMVAIYSKF